MQPACHGGKEEFVNKTHLLIATSLRNWPWPETITKITGRLCALKRMAQCKSSFSLSSALMWSIQVCFGDHNGHFKN